MNSNALFKAPKIILNVETVSGRMLKFVQAWNIYSYRRSKKITASMKIKEI